MTGLAGLSRVRPPTLANGSTQRRCGASTSASQRPLFHFFHAITAPENHALTLVEETHYQLITTGIERVREHVKEELDEQGNVIKRLRERTRETVIDPAGMRWFMERRDPSVGPRCA